MALAGAAAADVAITGSAEMGVSGGDGNFPTLFHQSVDVRFAMTGETDGGLSFGATVDIEDIADRGINGADTIDDRGVNPDYSTFIRGAFGTLTLGDTDGAFDARMTEVNTAGGAGAGSIADDHTGHAGFYGNDGFDGAANGQIARYDYSFGAITVSASAELEETNTGDDVYALGASWGGEVGGMTVALGLGYHAQGDGSLVGLSAGVESNGFEVILNYTTADDAWRRASDTTQQDYDGHMAIGVGYTAGALILSANYGIHEYSDGTEDKGFGAAANYNLGGGVTAMLGYGSSDRRDGTDRTRWSAGLSMAF